MANIMKNNNWVRNFFLTSKAIYKLSDTKSLQFRTALDQYWNFMTARRKSRGDKETVTFLKELKTLSVKLTLGIKYEALPFTKSDKSGFPSKLSLVKPFLIGDSGDKRIGLSIIELYKTITLPIDTNTDTITGKSEALGPISSKWTKFLKNNFSKKFRPQRLDWNKDWRSSNKLGPNGPGTLTSMVDLWSVRKDERVFKNIMDYLRLTGDDLYNEIEYLLENNPDPQLPKLPTGRLAFLPEAGGKTRVIAIGDYFSQQALTPLFQETMKMLKSIPQDGTYDQQRSVSLIKLAMKDGRPIYCYDLKSATDRFPREIQENLVEEIFGHNVGQAWGKLLTDRSFTFQGKDIEYAVGQPMGFLSSWSVFALTHHAFIQYCASRCGLKDFKDYTVLGDDVAIFSKRVASRYTDLMAKVGVRINLQKSLVWEPGMKSRPFGEFAKRIIWNETDITPIPLDLLETYWKAPVKEFFSLWFSLKSFGIDISEQTVNKLSSHLGHKDREWLSVLASSPDTLLGKVRRKQPTALYEQEGKGPWKGLDLHLIPAAMIKILYEEFYTKTLEIDKICMNMGHYDTIVNEISRLQGRSLVKRSTLTLISKIPIKDGHPLQMVIHSQRTKLILLLLKCQQASANKDWSFDQVDKLWESVFQSTDDVFSLIQTKKSKYSEIQSSIVINVYKLLKQGFFPLLKEMEDLEKEYYTVDSSEIPDFPY
jgi:hypothetical protein